MRIYRRRFPRRYITSAASTPLNSKPGAHYFIDIITGLARQPPLITTLAASRRFHEYYQPLAAAARYDTIFFAKMPLLPAISEPISPGRQMASFDILFRYFIACLISFSDWPYFATFAHSHAICS